MILEKIKDIVVTQFNVEANTITLETSFRDDLNADSLDLVELIMALEDEFDLEIEDELSLLHYYARHPLGEDNHS